MKKIIILLFSLLLTCCMFTNIAADNDIKIIDEANVLNADEEIELTKLINQYINHSNFDMVVYIAENKISSSITDLADDTFDYNDYGIGSNKEGIILCFDFYYREYTITTHGVKCIDTYSDKALNDIYASVTPYLKEDRIFEGVKAFIQGATYVNDNYDLYHKKTNTIGSAITPALIGSAIITLIAFLIMSSKLKSQGIKTTASQYMSNANIDVLRSGEVYLYSTVTRTKIAKANNNNGSTTHVSHSGQVHGGGGSHKV